MTPFHINFLDHVAIKVRDMAVSAEWYERVLGLKKHLLPEWGEYPVLMLTGRSGVAIFPAKPTADDVSGEGAIKIHHFAFNVTATDFEKAKQYFKEIGQAYEFQDHVYFHSIYIKDPDRHTVELTTLVADENTVYK